MKKVIYSIFYLSLLIVINYGLSRLFKLSFAEMSFPVGLISTILIGFFSSEGGITSQMLDLKIGDMKSCVKNHRLKLHMSLTLKLSIIYMIASGIFSVIYY
jgi:hypothetical protein